MNVLHIQSSPRGDKSNSIALTKAFLSASRKVLPTIDEDVLNIWDENLRSLMPYPSGRSTRPSSTSQ
jgi:FMN-dependent NADH-azoreductase